jgi:hypothetical protein
VEFTMTRRDAAPAAPYAPLADFWDLLFSATNGVFPGSVLEALIARMEAGK